MTEFLTEIVDGLMSFKHICMTEGTKNPALSGVIWKYDFFIRLLPGLLEGL
jgi:hypothetical protein